MIHWFRLLVILSIFHSIWSIFLPIFTNYLQFQAAEFVENNRPPRDWPSRGVVRMDDYATRYRPNLDLVLRGITCDFKEGEKVIAKVDQVLNESLLW